MLSRRDLLQASLAWMALGIPRARAAEPDLATLSDMEPLGQVTLLNITDLHAQLCPLYHREPVSRPGLAADSLASPAGSLLAYALEGRSFDELARQFGPLGGVAHLATVLARSRAQRPGQTLFIDCGDAWQGSYTAQQTNGADMVAVMNALAVDVTTGHWEFTYGPERVKDLIGALKAQFLCANVHDETWDEPVFPSTAFFQRGGVTVAVIGQAYPFTPIANPRYLVGPWRFGLRPDNLQKHIDAARAQGAELVVIASHNGFALDCALAQRLRGVDVILTGHTHEALPHLTQVGRTVLVAAGSHGKFLARLDVQVENGRMSDTRFRLIPLFSQAIAADPTVDALVNDIRRPYRQTLHQIHGHTESALYRQDCLGGPFDGLLCDALRAHHGADLAFSPGFRWGGAVPAGSPITGEDIHNQTAISYEATTLRTLSGAEIKDILEDVADNRFNPDPFYRQGGDMVRVGGLSFTLSPDKPIGHRLGALTLTADGSPLQASGRYRVAGWASLSDPGDHSAALEWGPPLPEVVKEHLALHPLVRAADSPSARDRVVIDENR
jgi:sulfur-oxidizing protein SoxB